jgi:hypothetical protein
MKSEYKPMSFRDKIALWIFLVIVAIIGVLYFIVVGNELLNEFCNANNESIQIGRLNINC